MKYDALVNEILSHKYEEEWFELKENFQKDDEIGEYISAISNGSAYIGKKQGFIIWGIDDKTHEIVGTKFNYYKNAEHNEPLLHYLARKLEPSIDFEFKEDEINGKRIVILFIDAAKNVPTSFDGVRYIRVGSSKEKISKFPNMESNLFSILKSGLPTLVNTKSNYQNLSFKKLFVYFAYKDALLFEETFKQNLHLLTDDGSYNVLAQLLSDDSQFPIRVSIFEGTDKSSNLFSVREFGNNCLLYSLDEILRYGDVLNILQTDETNRVVERKEVSLFDNNAFREAIINAFVHNRWIDGYAPMISVFSDRIEILSRGSLPSDQTMEGFFLGESKPVNKELADVLLKLHISEQSGRGVPKIVKIYGRDIFEFRENSIVVRIPFNWINEVGKKVGNKVGNNKLNINRQKIISEIKNNSGVTTKQLAVTLGLSETAVDNNLRYLRDNGYIKHGGARKNGYWEIL